MNSVDDMVDTAGTLCKAADVIKEMVRVLKKLFSNHDVL
jgi:phosphoribosylpyrophosphate synthetase